MATLWKLNRFGPSVCNRVPVQITYYDGEEEKTEIRPTGCIYHHLFDVLAPPYSQTRIPRVASIERICSAHEVSSNAAKGKLLWGDGNWKDLDLYIEYQREWFHWLDNRRWKAKIEAGVPDYDEIPKQIAKYSIEPIPPGSVRAPSTPEVSDMNRIFNWVHQQDAWLGTCISLLAVESGIDPPSKRATKLAMRAFRKQLGWKFIGAGDNRALIFESNGVVNSTQLSRIRDIISIQFGPGKIVLND